MASFRFVNMAGGRFVPEGQRVSVRIEKGPLEKDESWDLAFGQQMSYVPQKGDKKIRIVPKGLPGMKTCTLTLTGQLREDVVLFVIEYPYKDVGEKKVNKEGKATYDEEREAIYGLWLADKKWAAAMAQRFPVLAPIWAKYR